MKCMFCREIKLSEEMYAENVCISCTMKMGNQEVIVAAADVLHAELDSTGIDAESATITPEPQGEYPYLITWKKYAVFKGRAARAEFFAFVLINMLIELLLNQLRIRPLAILFWVASVTPFIAVAVRRLHDSGLSGWWSLIPTGYFVGGVLYGLDNFSFNHLSGKIGGALGLISMIVWFWLMLRRGHPGPNKYGPNPYEADA